MEKVMQTREQQWWRGAVAYQVYVPSFADSIGDGVGDLDGVSERLDALVWLGVDVIWLSPIFESPMRDGGYDISNYHDLNPMFGDLAALDRLIEAAHELNIRVLLDWVPNHTSTDHPWFVESASSTTNTKRDWYVWVDEAGDAPPNNWQSCFAAVGSAWSRHPITGAWYLHSFLREQADLNWDNPAVVAAAHDVMRFWLDRGIDGFRIDVVHNLGKDPDLADNPSIIVRPTPETAGRRLDEDHWPNLWHKIAGIRSVLDEYPGTIAVGESYVLDAGRLAEYTRPGRLHLAHDFTLTELDWDATAFVAAIDASNRAVGENGWPAWILSSHDHGRLATRWTTTGALAPPGTGVADTGRAEAALTLLLLMRGTPFLFQGEELALPDATGGANLDVDGRSRSRAPLPWTNETNAGFTAGTPWMAVPETARALNRQHQRTNPDSTLRFIRDIIALRRDHRALRDGSQQISVDDGVLHLDRRHGEQHIVVSINMSLEPRTIDPISTPLLTRGTATAGGRVCLDPNGIVVTVA